MKLLSHYQKNITPQKTRENWKNYSINDGLLYSHRNTVYDSNTFPSNLHYHDYYELIVFEEGNVRYICEDNVYSPEKGDIVLIPPGRFHTSVIHSESTRYCRHVFYFYPDAFDIYDCTALFDFAKQEKEGCLIAFSEGKKKEIISLLHKINSALSAEHETPEYALRLGCIFQFFYLLNQKAERSKHAAQNLPENILALKTYIDNNYETITSVEQIAKHFFYTREHTSRLFKKYFDISISDYLLRRRILESQKKISEGSSIAEAAYAVGFNSMSAFIHNFRKITGLLPSEYAHDNRR